MQVALHGTAEPGPFRDYLASVGSDRLLERAGRAVIQLSSISTRYLGLRFSELVVVVAVEGDDGAEEPHLVEGYNTSRLFTFFETHSFGTPYRHARVEVGGAPGSLDLHLAGGARLTARIERARGPTDSEEETWEGPIHLADRSGRRRYFRARLAGRTEHLPFAGGDTFEIADGPGQRALALLRDSRFQPGRWSLRPRARHARSNTFSR